MNVSKLAISAAMMICLSGCSLISELQEARIELHKQTCESIGFKPQTDEYLNCVLDLEKSYLSGRGNDDRTRQLIDNDRQQRQILNHGAGGCTPNFATGGCL